MPAAKRHRIDETVHDGDRHQDRQHPVPVHHLVGNQDDFFRRRDIEVEKQRTENEEKRERLEGYRNGREKMVTKEEKEKVDAEYKYWAAKRQARKRAFDNLEDLFLAGMTREELWERAGIEGEE